MQWQGQTGSAFFAILAIIGMILKQKMPLAGIPGAFVTAPLMNRNR